VAASRPIALIAAALIVGLPATTTAADPLDIDVIIPITGQASFVGQVEEKTIRAAEEAVNKSGGIKGRLLHFNVRDDASNPQTTVQFVSDAIAKKQQVIVGPSLSASCRAALPMLKDGPVSYCLSPGVHPPTGSYMFSSDWGTDDTIRTLVRYARLKGWRRVAILTSTDSSGQDAERGIDDALALPENNGTTVVAREHFGINDISIAAQLARIKAANPQVLIGWASGTPFGTIVRGMTDAGMAIPLMASNSNTTYATMHTLAQYLPKELLFPAVVTEANLDQLRRGTQRRTLEGYLNALKALGMRPEEGSFLVWDGLQIIVEALRKLGPNAPAPKIRAYIADLQGWVGIHGSYDFVRSPQRGLDANGVIISRWAADRDTWVPVSRPGGTPL
jgi:branched-chain amino acid transport system substrate-binding protein